MTISCNRTKEEETEENTLREELKQIDTALKKLKKHVRYSCYSSVAWFLLISFCL